jgi:hypothetical protein
MLTQQPEWRRAQRFAHGNFRAAADAPHHHQIGDIRTSDEQHERAYSQHDRKRCGNGRAAEW